MGGTPLPRPRAASPSSSPSCGDASPPTATPRRGFGGASWCWRWGRGSSASCPARGDSGDTSAPAPRPGTSPSTTGRCRRRWGRGWRCRGGGPPPPLCPTLLPWEEPVPPGAPTPPNAGPRLGEHPAPHNNVKEFVVTVALEGRCCGTAPTPGQRWYSQLLALLAVEDEPVLGYTAPTPLTQLHLHLCRCALDYRPPPLPLRVLVTAETLSVTSTIVTDTAVFLLRLMVDDGAVFLTDRWHGDSLDLQRDYVCVLDVDFLELLVTTWKGNDEGQSPPCPRE
ncbi:autophagy-related protein 2 homolog A-like isoform X4 [Ciconia boyciana]|uniref:autophagy-related protein 2 homolog A-like isoform X4 n=1 Tax=Ciconia boyciana TaxID=52775 RepID=UPI003BA3A99E